MALASFVVVAAAPFLVALGGCSKESASSAPAASTTPSGSDSAAGLPNGPVALSTDADADTDADASPGSPRSPRQSCALLQKRFEDQIAQNKSCKADEDCTTLQTGCGISGACGVAVAKTNLNLLEKKSILWNALRCPALLASPCPTCSPPKPPKCVSGTCQ